MHVNQILFPYHTKIGILREIFNEVGGWRFSTPFPQT